MKGLFNFCCKSVCFAVLASIYFGIQAGCMLYNDKYKDILPGREIYWAIDKSKKLTKKKKVVIGDSTGNQFFNNQEDSDSIYSLACNQSIGMVGHYILLHNFLEAGNRPDVIYMVFRPFSFGNNLDDNFTYQDYLKKFYYNDNKPYMTETVIKQIHKIPYYWLCHFPTIQTTTWTPKYSHSKRDWTFLSPITKEYIGKIVSLSNKYNFKVIIVPTFVSESLKQSIEQFNRQEIDEIDGHVLLEEYLNKIEYLPDSCFWDGSHLTHPENYKERFMVKLN